MSAHRDDTAAIFALLTEIGIIAQLAGNAFERRMPEGLSLAQFSVLNHLSRLGGRPTPVELARAMQVTKGAMTQTLANLERRGLVEFVAHESDGRSKRVVLLPAGGEARAAAIAALRPELESLASDMPAATTGELLPLLQDVRRLLDRRRD